MKQPHRPRERDVARAHHDALAAHAAQSGEPVSRGKPAAIDDEVGASSAFALAEDEARAGRLRLSQQKIERGVRGEMRFAGIIERGRKALAEIGLERLKRVAVEPL